MVSARPNQHSEKPQQARLRLLAITDLHARLLDYDYDRDRPAPGSGLVCLAGHIAAARAEVPGTLLFDNGDTYQGTALGEYLVQEGGPHPIAEALAALQLDAAVPGNHDFNFGTATLLGLAETARFPFVLTNLVSRRGAAPAEDTPLLPPTLLLERHVVDADGVRHPIRIGVLGFVPPQTMGWDHDLRDQNIECRDIVEAACGWLPGLKRAGADIVVALCHSGLGPVAHAPGLEDAARLIARLPGIDAVISGHRHDVTSEAASAPAAPIVAPGCNGSHLGQIDLVLGRTAPDGPWQVQGSDVSLLPAARIPGPAAAPLARIAAPSHARLRATLSETIGWTDAPLHSFFAGVLPSAATALIADVQARFVREMLANTAYQGLPVLAAAAPFKTGGPDGTEPYTLIPTGPIRRHHVFDLYPFPNKLVAMKTDGHGIRAWLERTARCYETQADSPAIAPLFAADATGHDFDLIHGLRFEVDLTQPPGARIGPIRFADGRALDPDGDIVLASNSYRMSGGGGFPVSEIILRTPYLVRDVLADHIARQETLAPRAACAWSLKGRPRTRVFFGTASEARDYLDGTPLEDPELTAPGRLRLHLPV